jgi:ubiquinone/menaquinone biosynthesis C-methylase UbiE
MVASSHHLEHIGRWDQEKVWGEMFRILKPGGLMEHIVPNIEWAAWKVMDGQIDDHTYNVLYGAQEAHDYERGLNTHFFGYTPQIARALAEQAGLVDVKVDDYKRREELGYNLIVSGRKPPKKRKSRRKK